MAATSECSIDGCEKKAEKRGWCGMHYRRWQRHGDVNWRPMTWRERFWSKVDKDGPVAALRPELGPCWIWTAGLFDSGYGQFSLMNSPKYAHRVAYEMTTGPFPEGLVLDHFACERRDCVNPSHVRPVTQWENVLRGNGIQSANRAKTHCKRGHEFTPGNTIRRDDGRACRACVRDAAARRYAADPERYRAPARESMARWRARNPELARQRSTESVRALRVRRRLGVAPSVDH